MVVKKNQKKKIHLTQKECLFCSFVSGKNKKQGKNYIFEILHKTPNTLSFHSIDFPSPKKEHVLVIPKKHYVNLEDCPKKVLHELIEHVSLISTALRIENEGTNLLLNDGRSAEQSVMHTHFHIVPRNSCDGIEIELWKRAHISEKEYHKLNDRIRRLISEAKKGIKSR